ncbi:unnamed protein product, partial [marine sediment metagenome]
ESYLKKISKMKIDIADYIAKGGKFVIDGVEELHKGGWLIITIGLLFLLFIFIILN